MTLTQSMFLSKEELRALTNRFQYAAQVRTLRGMGLQHRVRPDGSVEVLRSHIELVFGIENRTVTRKPSEPNWGALHATSS